LAIHVAYSTQVHETTRKAVYLRVGRKNQRLGVNDILRLAYAKGQAAYEVKAVEEASFDDLDQALVAEYCTRIGATGEPGDVLYSRDLLVRQKERRVPTLACLLLFAQKPQRYLPRCGIDFLKFEGTRQLVGQELNIIKRKIIERPLLHLIRRAIEVVGMHVREYSRLGPDGLFRTAPEYPPFAWQEAIVNAVAHRDYSITGKAIQACSEPVELCECSTTGWRWRALGGCLVTCGWITWYRSGSLATLTSCASSSSSDT